MISGGQGLIFKGTGFYITDYGKDGKGPRKDGEAATSGEAKTEPKGEATAESKPDSKGAPKANRESASKGDSKPDTKPASTPKPRKTDPS